MLTFTTCLSMALWVLFVLIPHYCEGLGTPAITVENDVGMLSLLQPTFVGRSVTFEFTPSKSTSIGDVRWYVIKSQWPSAKAIEEDDTSVQRKGNSTLLTIADVDLSFNRTIVYTSVGNKTKSASLELNLKDYTNANGCGELYFLSEGPYFAGDNLSLGYFSSPLVAKEKNSSKFSVKLIIGNIENHTSIEQEKGVSKLDQEGHEFIFTLFNVKKNDSGQYLIQCLNGISGKYSNSIHLSIIGKPIIGPLATISTCRECIILKTEETLARVFCETDETDEEYNATNVAFKIGRNQYASNKLSRNRFGLKSYDEPASAFHQLNVICTVFGKHRNMSMEASIFVVVRPTGPPHLSANEVLLAGETVDITCTSSSARPQPLLRFLVDDTKIDTKTNVSTTFDDLTGLYKSVSKLHTFKKKWGNKNMSCQQLPEVNGLYHETVSNNVNIVYKFPPSRLILVVGHGTLSKYVNASCRSIFSYPACNIKWESTIEHFKYTQLQTHTFNHTTVSRISFNVTHEDFGKRIRCSTECQYFQNTLSNSTTVIFSKKPTVVINSTPVLPVPPTTYTVLTCAANAYPIGNISWTTAKSSHSISAKTKLCSNTSTCIYEITTSDVEQEYFCIAKNEHGSDRGSIIVTIQERKDERETRQSGKGSFLWIVVSVIAVVTLGSFVLIVCCCRKRLKRVYENLYTHQVRNMYQGSALPSLYRHTETKRRPQEYMMRLTKTTCQ
ncbi:uncharacterized protein LOC128234324 isoform X2 [Mya arenaria]|uniref:uncharacterized protein LOC128234324 isoform X2 n=1 Tax=Mya arenaria TaxID=6604 RepID=UPI0022E7C6FB|nr:uncharacterized protein LOC128234324 isoform X2 [Mya arenaria]